MSTCLLDQMTVRITGPSSVRPALLDDLRLVLEEHLNTVSAALHDQFGERHGLTITVVDE